MLSYKRLKIYDILTALYGFSLFLFTILASHITIIIATTTTIITTITTTITTTTMIIKTYKYNNTKIIKNSHLGKHSRTTTGDHYKTIKFSFYIIVDVVVFLYFACKRPLMNDNKKELTVK